MLTVPGVDAMVAREPIACKAVKENNYLIKLKKKTLVVNEQSESKNIL